MIKKPELTQDQKEWFVTKYKAIVNELPEADRKKYDHESVIWLHDIPHFSLNSHQYLPLKLKHKYSALKNRLDNRSFD